jgi:hypothetical protein
MSIQPYPSANGRNVNVVQLADFDGTWLGEFSKRGAEWWTGKGVLPVAKQADESYRDDWSVYLYRPIDRTHFQLDLHTKKVKVKDPRYGSYDFLAIVDASAEVNGRVASQVFYTNNWRGDETGMFVQASDGQWLEQSLPDKQTRFRFREVGRDDWSVYLYDQSRDVHVQLDMYSDVMRVNFRMGYESSFRPLYNILLAK